MDVFVRKMPDAGYLILDNNIWHQDQVSRISIQYHLSSLEMHLHRLVKQTVINKLLLLRKLVLLFRKSL